MKHLLLSSMIICLITASCKKSSDDSVSLPDGLLNKNWKLTRFNMKINGGPSMNVLGFWDDCERDDIYIFKPGGQLIFDEGVLKCNPTDPQQHTDGS